MKKRRSLKPSQKEIPLAKKPGLRGPFVIPSKRGGWVRPPRKLP